MPVDLTKKLRTRCGEAVRLLCTDAKSPYPVIALITNGDGVEHPEAFTAEGRLFANRESADDLLNVSDAPAPGKTSKVKA